MKATMKSVIKYCKEVGNHFFDKETMKFWGSKVESDLLPNGTFVISEYNFDRTKRLYTVRKYDSEAKLLGDIIKTVGEFQEYETLADAMNVALHYRKDKEE